MQRAVELGCEELIDAMGESRERAIYLSVEQVWRVAHAVRPVQDAFGGFAIYYVGSVLERADWRDVDLRLILPDAEFDRIFVPAAGTSDYVAAPLYDQFRMLLQTSVSFMLRRQTSLPIDFQVQSQVEADQFEGERNPAVQSPYVGPDFVPQWIR